MLVIIIVIGYLLYMRMTFRMIYYYTSKWKCRNREPVLSILLLYAITLIQYDTWMTAKILSTGKILLETMPLAIIIFAILL